MILVNSLKSCSTCAFLRINRQYSHVFNPKYLKQLNVSPLKNNLKNKTKLSSYNVNTNVIKDVILYKYENPKMFKVLNIFALCQFGFWTYLAGFAYTTLKDAPVQKDSEDAAWWRKINLGENKYRNTLTVVSFLMGYGILVGAWIYSLKSVRFLILRKGGQAVTFVTYGPFGKNRMMTVDLKYVCCKETRENAKSYLPIKVKNQYLHYILDSKGEFKNKQLFDNTAGLKRVWGNSI